MRGRINPAAAILVIALAGGALYFVYETSAVDKTTREAAAALLIATSTLAGVADLFLPRPRWAGAAALATALLAAIATGPDPILDARAKSSTLDVAIRVVSLTVVVLILSIVIWVAIKRRPRS